MAVTITIAGTDRSSKVHVVGGALAVTRRLGARATCRLTTLDPAASGMYRPAVDDAVTVVDGAVTKFGGVIVDVDERGFVGTAGAVVTVDAVDFSAFLDYVLVRETYASGQTLQQIVSDLVTTYLAASPYSLTLDAGMASGPTLGEVAFDLCTVAEAFAELATISGWTFWVDFSRVVHWQAGATGAAAPFSVTESDTKYREGSLSVRQTRTDYRNRQYVRYGSGEQYIEAEAHTSDGVSREYVLDVPCKGVPNHVTVSGTVSPVGVYGVDDMEWTFRASDNTAVQRASDPIVPNGTVTYWGYYGVYPAVTSAEDAGEVASHGPRERVIDAPETFDQATAEDLAEGYVRRYAKTPPRVVTLETFEDGVEPGQILTVDLPTTRDMDDVDCLVTETVETLEDGLRWVTTVKAIEGDERGTEWDDLYKTWGKAGSSASGSASVSGGSSPTAVGIAPYFLGSTDVQGVRSATPDWTPACGFEIELDGSALSGALVTCKVMVRALAAGVSVQARIAYWTGSAWSACGTGTAKTSTSWTSDSFTVTVAATTTRYRLELLPGAAGQTVYGVGYVEAVR